MFNILMIIEQIDLHFVNSNQCFAIAFLGVFLLSFGTIYFDFLKNMLVWFYEF